MRKFLALTVTALVSLSCGSATSEEGAVVSQLEANITGNVVWTYHGDAEFRTGRSHFGGQQFQLNSVHLDPQSKQTFGLQRFDGSPRVGRYRLAPHDSSLADAGTMTAAYTLYDYDNNLFESYTSLSGVLEVTFSSDERVEATFTFTGLRFCASSLVGTGDDVVGSCSPAILDLDAPRVLIVGSFTATPEKEAEIIDLKK